MLFEHGSLTFVMQVRGCLLSNLNKILTIFCYREKNIINFCQLLTGYHTFGPALKLILGKNVMSSRIICSYDVQIVNSGKIAAKTSKAFKKKEMLLQDTKVIIA